MRTEGETFMEKEQVERALTDLASLSESIARIEEVESSFAKRLASLQAKAEALRDVQNRIESSFASIQIAINAITSAVSSAHSLTKTLEETLSRFTELDPQGLKSSLDAASSGINKGLDRILKAEREKSAQSDSLKGLVKGRGKRK